MKIIHIINSLRKGGAEGNLYRLCKVHKKKYQNKVKIFIITLISNGYYENDLKKKGINIVSLDIKGYQIIDILKKIILFRKFIKKNNPDIIQSWMYHSNFISLFIQKTFYQKLFWNIRHSELNIQISKKITIVLSIICGLFSRFIPNKIIYCSERSIFFHKDYHFYEKNKASLIYNGFCDRSYYNSKKLKTRFRKKYKFKNQDIVIGFAGRYAKQKNIQSLLVAFSKIIKKNRIYLCMVGSNININNKELITLISELKIRDNVFILNEQKNLLEFYNGINFLVLPSHSESFPNVVAESMLCSTPVLSSNAGCAKEIINNFGFVMNNNDEKSIYKNILKVIKIFKYDKKKWKFIKKNARIRIKNNYSIEVMAKKYFKTWIF